MLQSLIFSIRNKFGANLFKNEVMPFNWFLYGAVVDKPQ